MTYFKIVKEIKSYIITDKKINKINIKFNLMFENDKWSVDTNYYYGWEKPKIIIIELNK